MMKKINFYKCKNIHILALQIRMHVYSIQESAFSIYQNKVTNNKKTMLKQLSWLK